MVAALLAVVKAVRPVALPELATGLLVVLVEWLSAGLSVVVLAAWPAAALSGQTAE